MAEHRCNEIEKELYEFKEQYAKNGVEMMRLALAIEGVAKEVKDHHIFSEENKKEERKRKKRLGRI